MPIELDLSQIQWQLSDFELKLDRIDMESVKRRTMKRTADAMAEMVRQSVVVEDDITSPAMNSKYSRGDGPPMATLEAWQVKEVGSGDRFVVTPHPSVRQRAIVLNFGHSGRITPNDSEVLKFTIDGVPVYRPSVEGPDPTGYWQKAYQRMQKSGKLRRIAEDELEGEIEEIFR